jgi:hypothetical protein
MGPHWWTALRIQDSSDDAFRRYDEGASKQGNGSGYESLMRIGVTNQESDRS